MELSALAQVVAFSVFASLAVLGALGMTTTMSMFRSAIFLMASFVGVAGLFILLLADLLGMLQVMMYVGGMLVMALFMVLLSGDPGGEMMASMMKLGGPERLFSLGLARPRDDGDHDAQGEHRGGDHDDMSMFTPIKMLAAALASVVGAALITLVVLRPDAWTISNARPDPDSAERIGHLLMGKYMVGFEGAGLLILLGIFGAVWIARTAHRATPDREHLRAAVDEPPRDIDGRAPGSEDDRS